MARARRNKKHNRNPTDPGSSTEEEFQEMEDIDSKRLRPVLRGTHQKSFIFHLIRYPLLLAIIILLLLNLLLYALSRLLVVFIESIFSLVYWRYSSMKRDLKNSVTYDDFIEKAQMLDKEVGTNVWKTLPSDELSFDETLLISITRRLKRDLQRNMIGKLCDTLRNSACKQDLAGIENLILYSRCYSGTKTSIDNFVDVVCNSLKVIYSSSDLSAEEKVAFFKQVSVTYGRSALCLSGGATLAYFHLGVMKALWEQGLLPSIITGTSAGAMMAAMVCVRTDEELHEIFNPSLSEKINCLSTKWHSMIWNLATSGSLLETDIFRKEALWFCKDDMTFLEAHELTGKILNVSVMSNEGHSKTKILNYINSPNITIRSAVVASSAIPGLLPACPLYVKQPNGHVVKYLGNGRLWRDGSMRADIPERELSQLFRVKYTIVSQVNPHVSLFFFRPRGHPGNPSITHRWRGGFLLACLVKLFLLDLNKWLSFVRDMELLPRILGANFSNLWLQSFEGNLTILPKFRFSNIFYLLYDPNFERLETFISDGERVTWPTISAISNRMRIEQCIGKLLFECRQQNV